MKFFLLSCGIVLVVLTLFSVIRSEKWWIRSADFPRLQIAVALAVILTAYLKLFGTQGPLGAAFLAALTVALIYQCFRIIPYTRFWPAQVRKSTSCNSERSVRLVVSNVLMTNRRAELFTALIREAAPDLILAVETDEWWDGQLQSLDRDYPYSVKQPQANTYGLHLFSRLELANPEVRFLTDADVPSVYAAVRLRSGDWIDFFGVHPRPPKPQQDAAQRDAEILIVAKQVEANGKPSIVAGDLNDVAWSHTTRLFQRISGTLDPRRGRGMFATFHAKYPMFRWPLDHIFHEASFTLVHLRRLPNIGSDHFPVLAELCFEPKAEGQQSAPDADEGDHQEAGKKIARIESQNPVDGD